MSKTTDNKLRPVRTIRLPVEQIVALLDEMDVEPSAWHSARRDSRYKYRLNEVVVLMQQPGVNAPVAYIVPTRNISARGLSFLHGGFVHPGTLCVVQLLTARGAQQNVVGIVRRCRYVQNNVHEVAVHFKNAIDPAAFCRDAVALRALVAEDDLGLAKLCKLHLGKLHCEVEVALDGPSAVESAMAARFDLVLLDMGLPPTGGFDTARELRARGYGGMIIGGTDSDEDRAKTLEAGCDLHLVKPFTYEQLSQATAALQSEPLFSTFHDDPAMKELIAEFVVGLPAKLKAIEQFLSAQDWESLRQRMGELKVEGQGFGFGDIANGADKVVQAIRSKAGPEDVAPLVRGVIRLCAQARCIPKAGAGVAQSAAPPAARERKKVSAKPSPPAPTQTDAHT